MLSLYGDFVERRHLEPLMFILQSRNYPPVEHRPFTEVTLVTVENYEKVLKRGVNIVIPFSCFRDEIDPSIPYARKIVGRFDEMYYNPKLKAVQLNFTVENPSTSTPFTPVACRANKLGEYPFPMYVVHSDDVIQSRKQRFVILKWRHAIERTALRLRDDVIRSGDGTKSEFESLRTKIRIMIATSR